MTYPKVLENPKEALAYWVKRLRLEDWVIGIAVNCDPDNVCKDSSGDVNFTECHKSAYIHILDGKFYGERILPFDADNTLVHELLHLKFSFIGESGNDLQDRVLHQIICDMAHALVGEAETSSKETNSENA